MIDIILYDGSVCVVCPFVQICSADVLLLQKSCLRPPVGKQSHGPNQHGIKCSTFFMHESEIITFRCPSTRSVIICFPRARWDIASLHVMAPKAKFAHQLACVLRRCLVCLTWLYFFGEYKYFNFKNQWLRRMFMCCRGIIHHFCYNLLSLNICSSFYNRLSFLFLGSYVVCMK